MEEKQVALRTEDKPGPKLNPPGKLRRVMQSIHQLLKVGTGIKFTDGTIVRVQKGGYWQRETPKAVKGKAAIKAAKKARRLARMKK